MQVINFLLVILCLAVAKSDVVNRVKSWVLFKQQNDLKKTDGKKKGKLNIPKLEEANFAATSDSDKCTLILTEGDSAKALAVCCLYLLKSHDSCTFFIFIFFDRRRTLYDNIIVNLFADVRFICCGARLLRCVSIER